MVPGRRGRARSLPVKDRRRRVSAPRAPRALRARARSRVEELDVPGELFLQHRFQIDIFVYLEYKLDIQTSYLPHVTFFMHMILYGDDPGGHRRGQELVAAHDLRSCSQPRPVPVDSHARDPELQRR